jgi:hypothetical protein
VRKGSERDTNVCEPPLVSNNFYLSYFYRVRPHSRLVSYLLPRTGDTPTPIPIRHYVIAMRHR